jgi:ribose 1,5-bisphosphokinase PhnN
MFNVCWQCGVYRADKTIVSGESIAPVALCPECGHCHPFRRLPLLVISGASGAGKSTVCQLLLGRISDVVLLDSDILWRPEFDTPNDHYRAFFETWLRMAKNIAQAGRPVVLFGAGMGVPANLEPCVERRYLGALHFLALTCDDDMLARRLRQRPAWRQSGSDDYIAGHVQFNRWFKNQAQQPASPIELLDTTDQSPTETARLVAEWLRNKLQA